MENDRADARTPFAIKLLAFVGAYVIGYYIILKFEDIRQSKKSDIKSDIDGPVVVIESAKFSEIMGELFALRQKVARAVADEELTVVVDTRENGAQVS